MHKPNRVNHIFLFHLVYESGTQLYLDKTYDIPCTRSITPAFHSVSIVYGNCIFWEESGYNLNISEPFRCGYKGVQIFWLTIRRIFALINKAENILCPISVPVFPSFSKVTSTAQIRSGRYIFSSGRQYVSISMPCSSRCSSSVYSCSMHSYKITTQIFVRYMNKVSFVRDFVFEQNRSKTTTNHICRPTSFYNYLLVCIVFHLQL